MTGPKEFEFWYRPKGEAYGIESHGTVIANSKEAARRALSFDTRLRGMTITSITQKTTPNNKKEV